MNSVAVKDSALELRLETKTPPAWGGVSSSSA